MLLSLRPLILGSRRIGWISSCTRGRAEVSELARPRRFSAPMLAILAAAVVGLRGPGASQPESLRSAFQEMCAKRWLEGQEKQIRNSQLARSSPHHRTISITNIIITIVITTIIITVIIIIIIIITIIVLIIISIVLIIIIIVIIIISVLMVTASVLNG